MRLNLTSTPQRCGYDDAKGCCCGIGLVWMVHVLSALLLLSRQMHFRKCAYRDGAPRRLGKSYGAFNSSTLSGCSPSWKGQRRNNLWKLARGLMGGTFGDSLFQDGPKPQRAGIPAARTMPLNKFFDPRNLQRKHNRLYRKIAIVEVIQPAMYRGDPRRVDQKLRHQVKRSRDDLDIPLMI